MILEGKKEDSSITISISEAAKKLGIKKSVLQFKIDAGYIKSQNGKILKSDFNKILQQRENFISLKEFMYRHDGERFVAKYSRHREKCIDFLENNDYFGATLYSTDDFLFAYPDKFEHYISIEDAEMLDFKCLDFFENYGLSEYEKATKILQNPNADDNTKRLIHHYIEEVGHKENDYTKAFTTFVDIIINAGDIKELTDEDILSLIDETNVISAQEYIVDFLNYVKLKNTVKYGNISLRKREKKTITAYSYDDFVGLAKLIFNVEYDKEKGLTKKALEKHIYAEQWLFLAIHYVCGWRASDICNAWIYPCLKSNINHFNINLDNLKEDILGNHISDETYANIASYVLKKIELSHNLPSKTGNNSFGKLRSEITPDLRSFFGKLILIAEYHNITSGDGYMKSNRIVYYCNWVNCTDFFGKEYQYYFGKRNLSSRRLNKSYLQGLEQSARESGNTALVAHMIASIARNHSNINSTAIYLRDHALTGEDAGTVLYMMMQRGVMSVYLYRILLSAFPDEFKTLNAKDQTKLIKLLSIKPLELEIAGAEYLARDDLDNALLKSDDKQATQILKAMYEIGNGYGKSKDKGVYCLRTALGYVCRYPAHGCIANVCPYHVFTNQGIPALLEVIKNYIKKYKKSGNVKYLEVLKQIIFPRYNAILKSITKDMEENDIKIIRKMIEEVTNE